MEVLLSIWRDLYAQRLHWAKQAYADFRESLDEELQGYFPSENNEVYVVLYGKTQVGKTTLLLKLMGVHNDVAKILRGGRSQGKSATATATRYSLSHDNAWRLTSDINTNDVLDDKGIEKELKKLRARVESGAFSLSSPVEVKIPRKYFCESNNHNLNVNILDLPGENASNAGEALHVRDVAKKYVPSADLILLVGRGDDLSFLKAEVLPIPEIVDWRYQPEKFRIITTYTTSAESYQNFLKNIVKPTKEQFRERLLAQIASFPEIILPDDVKHEYFYPLEFGNSWQELQNSDPELFDKVCFVIDGKGGLFNDLQIDIERSATEHGRIMAAMKTHEFVIKHRARGLEKSKVEIKGLYDSRENRQKKVSSLLGQCSRLYKEIKKLNKDVKDNQEALNEARKQVRKCIFSEGIDDSVRNKNRKDLYAFLTSRHEDIIKSFDDFVAEGEEAVSEGEEAVSGSKKALSKLTAKLPRNKISQCADSEIQLVRDWLEKEYFADKYWVSSHFERDLSKCRDGVTSAVQSVHELCNHLLSGVAETLNKTMKGQISTKSTESAGFRESCNRLKKELCSDELAIKTKMADRLKFKKRMSDSIKLGHDFSGRITKSFYAEIRTKKHAMDEEKLPARRFIKLVSLVQVCEEKNKLFTNSSK